MSKKATLICIAVLVPALVICAVGVGIHQRHKLDKEAVEKYGFWVRNLKLDVEDGEKEFERVKTWGDKETRYGFLKKEHDERNRILKHADEFAARVEHLDEDGLAPLRKDHKTYAERSKALDERYVGIGFVAESPLGYNPPPRVRGFTAKISPLDLRQSASKSGAEPEAAQTPRVLTTADGGLKASIAVDSHQSCPFQSQDDRSY